MNTPSLEKKTLTSEWMAGQGGLSKHLIATFYEVDRVGANPWRRVENSPSVKAPLTEANIEVALGWNSPFEGAGVDRGTPAIAAMLQSGALQPYFEQNGKASEFLSKFEGRSGITKLNSTQVFAGMQPVKIQVTALFRAWKDPKTEVDEPVEQLMQWALPKRLAPDGAIMSALTAIKQAVGVSPLDEASANALLPSESPCKIAMHYKGRLFSPLVIESIGMPINSPVAKDGNNLAGFVELLIPMTLGTLAALDRNDWAETRKVVL